MITETERDRIEARAQAGAELLDKIKPDWAESITEEQLEAIFLDNRFDPLTIIFGNFMEGLNRIGYLGVDAEPDKLADLGFFVRYSTMEADILKTGWTKEIGLRKGLVKTPPAG